MTDRVVGEDGDTMTPSQLSLGNRLKSWWNGLPAVTRSIFIVCTSVHAASLLFGLDLGLICLSPVAIITRVQLWRIPASAAFHVGILHLVFNMMAFLTLGTSLEYAVGSLCLAWLIGLLILGGSGLYIGIAYVTASVGYPALLRQCAVGFSGVIFGLIPIESRISSASNRSIFGLFTVPSPAYPWVLMLLWQVLVPQSSFLGHLSGLTVGQLFVLGGLRWACPSDEIMQQWERADLLQRWVASPSWIANCQIGFGLRGGSHGRGVNESLLPVSNSASNSIFHLGSVNERLASMISWGMPAWMPAFFQQQQEHQGGADGDANNSNENIAASTSLLPRGSVLGGTASPESHPKAAAAAAAEARASK